MSRRLALTQRSAAEWAIRIGLAVVAAWLALLSVAQVYAYAIRGRDPERAHALAPNDGRVTAALSQIRLGDKPSVADRAAARSLARDALQHEPTAVAAASTLGLDADLAGNKQEARRLFGYAAALSRRDLRTQAWAVQDTLLRGDVEQAMRHFDIALRTSRVAPDLLFPILAQALADDRFRSALIRTLSTRPVWAVRFVDYVAEGIVAPRETAMLLRQLQRAAAPVVSNSAPAMMVNSLLAARLPDEAWSYYTFIRPGVDRRRSRDPRFATNLARPSPFDWVPINEGAIATSIRRDGANGFFEFSAPTGAGGAMLRQVQLLPPGRYQLTGHGSGIDQAETAAPYWALTCSDGRELGRVVMSPSSSENGTFGGELMVPAGCAMQTLSLIARPSDAIMGVTGQIDRIMLIPVGERAL